MQQEVLFGPKSHLRPSCANCWIGNPTDDHEGEGEEEEEETPEPPEPTAAEIVQAGLAPCQLDKECVAIDQCKFDEVEDHLRLVLAPATSLSSSTFMMYVNETCY